MLGRFRHTMNVVTKLAKLQRTLWSVLELVAVIGNSLQHGISVETELILDHAIRNLFWHFFLGHLMCGEVVGREAGSIHGGGEFIVSRRLQGDVFKARDY